MIEQILSAINLLGLDWNFFSSHSQVEDSQAGSLDYSGLSEI
jgi:hypothetical protein